MAKVTEASGTAADWIPAKRSMKRVREAAAGCRACPLWKTGTQTVFGEGLLKARLILVGEQPGDEEDKRGRPFVGPAGRVLDQALDEVGIARSEAYVTNAVKHFKWEPKGKRRLHKKPNGGEIEACKPWLKIEIDLVRPKVLVALGATAAQAMFGPQVRVLRDRGTFFESELAPHSTVTVHPSSILRARDDREAAMASFVADMKKIAKVLHGA